MTTKDGSLQITLDQVVDHNLKWVICHPPVAAIDNRVNGPDAERISSDPEPQLPRWHAPDMEQGEESYLPVPDFRSCISEPSTFTPQFCFTGGYFEASVQLPGSPKVAGLWPAVVSRAP